MKKAIILFIYLFIIAACTQIRPVIITRNQIYLSVLVNEHRKRVGLVHCAGYKSLDRWLKPGEPIKISINWATGEPSPGVYNWIDPDRNLGEKYHPDIITFAMTPKWALPPWETKQCKLPAHQYWDDFARFINQAMARYCEDKPCDVELLNEPDIDGMYPYFGCVLDGEKYAQFVNEITPLIHGEDRIYAGALSLAGGYEFAEDMLKNLTVDVDISYHCYPTFINGQMGPECIIAHQKMELLTDRKLLLSESAVRYYSGIEKSYNSAQREHFRWMCQFDESYWFSLNNCWPAGCCATDKVCHDIPRPVYYDECE